MYKVTVEQWNREWSVSGDGEDWRAVATALYRKRWRRRPWTRLVSDTYFRRAKGFPIGTHHVRFGTTLPDGRVALDAPVIVRVRRSV